MPPTLADRLRHIIESIDNIDHLLAGKSFQEFVDDAVMQAAVERFLERVSEASRHIPSDLQSAAGSIPWRRVADFGSVLRHANHSVDAGIVWQIATRELAPLRAFALELLHRPRSGSEAP